jgi:hypothetical protein
MTNEQQKQLSAALAKASQALGEASIALSGTTTTTTTKPPTTTTTPPPTSTTQAPINNMKLGINMAGVRDYSTEIVFKNIFKQSRQWTSQVEGQPYNSGPQLSLDENGWVTKLDSDTQFAESLMMVDIDGHVPNGDYELIADGTGVIEFNGMASGRFAFPSSGLVQKVRIQSTPGKPNQFLALRIRKTDPNDYIRNISLSLPQYGNSPFHQSLINRYAVAAGPYKVVRFMDWIDANNSFQKEWADRPKVMDRSWALGKGVPLEIVIQFANEIGLDPWICIPHLASDDYVKQMAELIVSTLSPSRKVYLEYSNECWNQIMAQAKYCQQMGVSLNLASDPYEAGIRYYSKRAIECFNLFRSVSRQWFNDPMCILSTHHRDIRTGQWALTHNRAFEKVHAIAVAPYWGHGDQLGDLTNSNVGLILDKCESLMYDNLTSTQAYANLASQYNLNLYAYESGQHMVSPTSNVSIVNLLADANRSPRMTDLYMQDFKNWQSFGGGLFMVFASMNKYGPSGYWGVLEYYDQETSPKQKAIEQISSQLKEMR